MHMLGEPRTMQQDPRYDDVVSDVKAFLEERLDAAVAAGVAGGARSSSTPGSASARRSSTTSSCCAGSTSSPTLGRPVVIGTSRKSFIGRLTGRDVTERVHGDRRHLRARATSAARACSASTTSPRSPTRSRWRLLRCAGWPDDPTRRGRRRRRPDDDDDDEEGPEVGVTVEIVGLSLYTHHGVTAAEREIGQRLVLDVRFDVGEPDALITDRVEDTVDYGEVCQVIALIAQQRSYKTLERLCAVIADRLASQFGAESVTVKASKPEPPIPLPGRGGLGRGLAGRASLTY